MTDRRDLLLGLGAGLLLASRPGLAAEACAPAVCRTCGPTGSATAGPFYVANAPSTMDINLLRAPGTPMQVAGLVLGGNDGRTPLANAVVELWHADSDGRYHPEANGDISQYRPEEINLRGQVRSDGQGRFAFNSIVPGNYANRRRHLHWRLSAGGHRPLVTQTYWQDERDTALARRDPVDRAPEDCRWLSFRERGGIMQASVVFVLQMLA